MSHASGVAPGEGSRPPAKLTWTQCQLLARLRQGEHTAAQLGRLTKLRLRSVEADLRALERAGLAARVTRAEWPDGPLIDVWRLEETGEGEVNHAGV